MEHSILWKIAVILVMCLYTDHLDIYRSGDVIEFIKQQHCREANCRLGLMARASHFLNLQERCCIRVMGSDKMVHQGG